MSKIKSNIVRKMVETDLALVLSWRNHPDVRKHMYTQHEITLIEHTSWFKSVLYDDGRHLLIYEQNNEPLGFININEINKGRTARSEEHTSELQSRPHLVCRLLLEKKKKKKNK